MDEAVQKGLEDFFSQYPLKQYHKGQILIYAHEDPRGIFYIERGMVRKYDVDPDGDELVLNVFKQKVFFPIEWALNKTANKYFFEAHTPIEVRCAPLDAFVAYLELRPELIRGLLSEVYTGLEDAHRRAILLMGGDTRRRLLFELLMEVKRSGEIRSDGSCLVTIGTGDLAQRAGLSRETISRELAKIVQSGDVSRQEGRSLLIKNVHDLERQLSGD
jgi:CRP-like cAMP-binding protein